MTDGGSGAGSTVDEWELRTDMLTGAIRLVCVRGERTGLIYEWQSPAHLAAMHEANIACDSERLRADLDAAQTEIVNYSEVISDLRCEAEMAHAYAIELEPTTQGAAEGAQGSL